MPTRRAMLLLVFAAFAYASGLVFDAPSVPYVSAVTLAVLGVSFAWFWCSCFGIECELSGDTQGVLGKRATLRVSLRNHWPVPRCGVLVSLIFAPAEEDERELAVWEPRLRPGRVTDVEVAVECARRGRFTVGPARLVYTDALGLFRRRSRVKGSYEIEVAPATVPLESLPILPSSEGYRDQLHRSDRTGVSSEFYAIRAYAAGDSLRWIHWLTTARYQKLMTRQYHSIVDRKTLVVLDCCCGPYRRSGTGSEPFETAVSAAASILRYGIENDHEMGLLTLSREPEVLRPASGMDHLRQAVSALSAVREESGRVLPDLSAPGLTQVRSAVLVTTSLSRDLCRVLTDIREQGVSVAVVACQRGRRYGRREAASLAALLDGYGIPVITVRNRASLREDLEAPRGLGRTPWSTDLWSRRPIRRVQTGTASSGLDRFVPKEVRR